MNQIIEYIVQHYAWIFGCAILILLAIIGYYADKTNFGQGKNVEPDKTKDVPSIDKMRIMDATDPNSKNEDVENKGLPDKQKDLDKIVEKDVTDISKEQKVEKPEKIEKAVSTDFLDAVEAKVTKKTENKKEIADQINGMEMPKSKPSTPKATKPKKPKLTAEEVAFNKFEKEFESLLPKKDIINADLLSDIDELELGKTQKIKLNEVPDLADIDLPKIKNLVDDEQDIWKF